MQLDKFVSDVLATESKCFEFLRRHGLFTDDGVPFPGKPGKACTSCMTLKDRMVKEQMIPYFRFGIKNCRAMRSMRSTNLFFAYFDRNVKATCNLSVRDIMRML